MTSITVRMNSLMKFFIAILSFFSTSVGVCQNVSDGIKEPVTHEEMEFAIEDYKIMLDSELFAEYEKTILEIGKGMGNQNKSQLNKGTREQLFAWLEQNIEKTRFKSFEEAKKLFTESHELYLQLKAKHEKLYAVLARTTIDEFKTIVKPRTERMEKAVRSNPW